MVIFAVDDERLALESLIGAVRKCIPEAEICGFRKAAEALEGAQEKKADIAFLDIEMRETNGISLADKLIELNPKVNIIFTTGYSEYAGKAFELHASGYILKPVTVEKVKNELMHLRYKLTESVSSRLFVRAFGNFEVYQNGRPLHFQYNKTKELFAYLIDRKGAVCPIQEIIAVLWEDDDAGKSHISYIKNMRMDLISTLKKHGADDVILRTRGGLAIIPENLDCDYFYYLEHGNDGNRQYRYTGEYMTQYSWGEYTHGQLERIREDFTGKSVSD